MRLHHVYLREQLNAEYVWLLAAPPDSITFCGYCLLYSQENSLWNLRGIIYALAPLGGQTKHLWLQEPQQ